MKRIVVGMIGGMGDLVACEPVARYLRKLNPDAEITWVGNSAFIDLFSAHPAINCLTGVRRLDEWIAIASDKRWDEVIDLHLHGWTQLEHGLVINKPSCPPFVTADNYFDFGGLLTAFCLGSGLPPLTDAPKIFLTNLELVGARARTQERPFIALHCSSSDTSRDWPDEKWKQLVTELATSTNALIVEVGVNPVLSLEDHVVINACGLTSRETAAIIAGASLFIGVDSGPAHLANASCTPCVIIAGRYRHFIRYFPFTGTHSRTESFRYIFNIGGPAADVRVEEVLTGALDILLTRKDKGLNTRGRTEICSSRVRAAGTSVSDINSKIRRNILVPTEFGTLIVNRFDEAPTFHGVGQSLLSTGTYASEEMILLRRLVSCFQKAPLVLDVGANIGVTTIVMAEVAASLGGTVIAFEPQRLVYQMLCGNLAINSIENVTAHHGALGDVDGFIAVPSIDYNMKASFGSLELGNVQREKIGQMPTVGPSSEKCQISRLDSLTFPRLDFIKIDVEGMEIQVLRGAEKTVKEFRPVVQVEWIKTGQDVLSDWFSRHNYRLHIFGQNLICIPAESQISVTVN